MQISRCSFDIHVADIVGGLIVGTSLVMIKPNSLVNLDYLLDLLVSKQITFIHGVPSLLTVMLKQLRRVASQRIGHHLRTLCSIGESPEYKVSN